MKDARGYSIGGILLIVLGLVFLLQNFGIVPFALELFWGVAFAAGGAVFLFFFVTDNRRNWWAVIPGFALLGLAGLMTMDNLLPMLPEQLGGSLFLGALSLAFWVVYINNREFWWAIIPGGVLLTLAVVASFADDNSGIETGGLFFLGLAATFLLVYLVPTPEGRMKWAIIPAAILGVMGFLLMAAMGNLIDVLWPLALILGGGYMVLRSLRRRTDSEPL